jgi:hypothetical protein
MIEIFWPGAGRRRAKPSLESIRFNTKGFSYDGELETGRVRVWHTQDGDGVGLYFLRESPDVRILEDPRAFYVHSAEAFDGRLIEFSVLKVAGYSVHRIIIKFRQYEPSAMTYVGSLTVPFRDFSFTLKAQCEERGIIGARETILLDRAFAAGEASIQGDRLQLPVEWNPDAEDFDAEFPTHPISRLRRILAQVGGSLAIDPKLGACPTFPVPREPPDLPT